MDEQKKIKRRAIKEQKKNTITPSQFKLLKYIWSFYEDFNFVPGTSVTAADFGLTRQAVWMHYDKLIKAGILMRDKPGKGARFFITAKGREIQKKYEKYNNLF
jgi:DNA-binding MarR family transcriptional regulator